MAATAPPSLGAAAIAARGWALNLLPCFQHPGRAIFPVKLVTYGLLLLNTIAYVMLYTILLLVG